MTTTLYWQRADKQGDIEMGEYADDSAASAAIPAMRAELIAQGADEEETDAGRWLAITDGKSEEISA